GQSQRRVEALTTDIRSEVREAHALMVANQNLARLYGETLLPERRRIVSLTLEHYNFMLKGTYDLLLVKQNELEAERSYIEAWRDYWIARAELEKAVGGKLPGVTELPAAPSATPEQPAEHHHHEKP